MVRLTTPGFPKACSLAARGLWKARTVRALQRSTQDRAGRAAGQDCWTASFVASSRTVREARLGFGYSTTGAHRLAVLRATTAPDPKRVDLLINYRRPALDAMATLLTEMCLAILVTRVSATRAAAVLEDAARQAQILRPTISSQSGVMTNLPLTWPRASTSPSVLALALSLSSSSDLTSTA